MGQSIQRVLKSAGHFCTAYDDGLEMLRALAHSTMDLLVLDWQSKRLAGAELLGSVRRIAGERLPIMFVSNDRSETSMVRALDDGADDYLVLPLQAAEFRARVAALLRRAYPERSTTASFDVGPYRFDRVRKVASLRGERVPLTSTQYRLAMLLFSNVGRVMSRDHIYTMVWGRELIESTRTIDTHVSQLRVLLEIEPRNGFLLRPVYKSGYRLLSLRDDARVIHGLC
jgi:DNA-binding response OmpR family regulator